MKCLKSMCISKLSQHLGGILDIMRHFCFETSLRMNLFNIVSMQGSNIIFCFSLENLERFGVPVIYLFNIGLVMFSSKTFTLGTIFKHNEHSKLHCTFCHLVWVCSLLAWQSRSAESRRGIVCMMRTCTPATGKWELLHKRQAVWRAITFCQLLQGLQPVWGTFWEKPWPSTVWFQ